MPVPVPPPRWPQCTNAGSCPRSQSNIGVRGAASPHKFAVCTDRAALQRWADHTGTESLRDPVDEGTRARALRGVDSAEHVRDHPPPIPSRLSPK